MAVLLVRFPSGKASDCFNRLLPCVPKKQPAILLQAVGSPKRAEGAKGAFWIGDTQYRGGGRIG